MDTVNASAGDSPATATSLMSLSPSTPASKLSPAEAWQPLPATRWNAATARHLLRRATWSAQPIEVERALADGLEVTLARLFPEKPIPFPYPDSVERVRTDDSAIREKIRTASTPEERRSLQKEEREHSRAAMQDMTVKWLQFAAHYDVAAQEKWELFLSDIYVVSYEKVHNPHFIYLHNAILRELGFGSAPELAKAISHSPAMLRYLDLLESSKAAPNENFARELFELFMLGEGNYTEQDIKQAARAFTGYRSNRDGNFTFNPRLHDTGIKTVFGHSGNFNGNDVIDLAFKLPAAAAFVPHEMARFYLTDDPLPKEYLASLGAWWSGQNFNLCALARRFFGSSLFYEQTYVGNYIKSPVQFYLGLLQDLKLDVMPNARRVINPLRMMGQVIFEPPNVRGWVGGRNWINSATLAARRQLVQNLFTPLNPATLNADEQAEIDAARAAGRDHFTITAELMQRFEKMPDEVIAETFLKTFLAGTQTAEYRAEVNKYIKGNGAGGPKFQAQRLLRIRNTAITLLQTPEYQLC